MPVRYFGILACLLQEFLETHHLNRLLSALLTMQKPLTPKPSAEAEQFLGLRLS